MFARSFAVRFDDYIVTIAGEPRPSASGGHALAVAVL
jgi:hypothetical protein